MSTKSASVLKDPDVDETQSTIDDNYVVVPVDIDDNYRGMLLFLQILTIIMLFPQIKPFTTSFLSAKSKTFICLKIQLDYDSSLGNLTYATTTQSDNR